MSIYANNEYIVSSNNSMNDNKYNSQKAAKSHRIKSILKPIMRMLRRNSSDKKNKFYPDCNTSEEEYCTECEDNSANEELECNIMDEITHCKPSSAIFVCNENGKWNVTPVLKEKAFVPVHFARTTAGTFFWTSISTSADSDVFAPRHCYTECQDAAEQIPMLFSQDRWVQA